MRDDGVVGGEVVSGGGEGSGKADIAMQEARSSSSSSSSTVETAGPGCEEGPEVFPRPQGFLELFKL